MLGSHAGQTQPECCTPWRKEWSPERFVPGACQAGGSPPGPPATPRRRGFLLRQGKGAAHSPSSTQRQAITHQSSNRASSCSLLARCRSLGSKASRKSPKRLKPNTARLMTRPERWPTRALAAMWAPQRASSPRMASAQRYQGRESSASFRENGTTELGRQDDQVGRHVGYNMVKHHPQVRTTHGTCRST